MPSEISNEISRFTADFLDGKVVVGGNVFPSGYFFMNAMNEYWKPYSGDDNENFEIAPKLMTVRFNRDKVQDEIALNFLSPIHAEKLYDDVQYYLKNIEQAKPFCFLDLATERERCGRIFGEENVAFIAAYLRERSLFHYEHDNGWPRHALPTTADIARFRDSEKRLREFIDAVKFYEEMGQGMNNAREIGRLFIQTLEAPTTRTESTLMSMAMDCIEKYRPGGFPSYEKDMRVNVEYVSVPKSKNRNSFEVGRRMTFQQFGDFLLADFFEGLHAGHYPLRCGVCKRYFLQTTAHRRKYCTGYAPGDPKGRSCEAVAARSNRLAKELSPDHPAMVVYSRRRGTIDKHLRRGKITKEQANAAKRYIEDLLYRAKSATQTDNYPIEQYEKDMEQDAVYAAVGIQLS